MIEVVEPLPRGRLSGVVVVVLADDLPDVDAARDLDTVARVAERGDLQEALKAVAGAPTERQVTSVPPAAVRRFERRARRRGDRHDPSLTKCWRIDLTDRGADPDEVAALFARLPSVRKAYAELAVDDPPEEVPGKHQRDPNAGLATAENAGEYAAENVAALPVAPPFAASATGGVGLAAVAALPGCRGGNVGLVDVEQGWRLSHPDLKKWDQPVLCNVNRDPHPAGNHGNAVMGVLVQMMPDAQRVRVASHARATKNLYVTDAIAAARQALRPGDVLLLEVARTNLPTETDFCDFVAIRDAVGAGVVVVEAAGNGGVNGAIDAWQVTDLKTGTVRRMSRDDPGSDSGAIMVGAVSSFTTPLPDGTLGHARWSTSNWGLRVDCHAWGEDVATCSADGTDKDFGETSAAAAIVAGLAAVAQSIRIAAGGPPLTSPQLRTILPAGGTPQAPEADGMRPVGHMPDMAVVGPVVATSVPIP